MIKVRQAGGRLPVPAPRLRQSAPPENATSALMPGRACSVSPRLNAATSARLACMRHTRPLCMCNPCWDRFRAEGPPGSTVGGCVAPGTPLQVRAWPGLRAGRADSLGPAARLRECEAEAATWAEVDAPADAPAGASASGGPALRHGTTAALPEAAVPETRPVTVAQGIGLGRAAAPSTLVPTTLPNAAARALFSLPHRSAACTLMRMQQVSDGGSHLEYAPLARLQAFPCASQALGTAMTHVSPSRRQGPRAWPARCPRRRRRRRRRRARPRTLRRPRRGGAGRSAAPRRPSCSAAAGRPTSWCCPAAGWRPSRAPRAAAAPPRLLPPRRGPSLARHAHPAGALPPPAALQHSQEPGPPLMVRSASRALQRLRSARTASFCALCAWTAWRRLRVRAATLPRMRGSLRRMPVGRAL